MPLPGQLPDPASVQTMGWVCLALFGAAGGVDKILKIWDRTRELPPPAQTYVAKPDCAAARAEQRLHLDRFEEELRRLRQELRADRDLLLQAGEARAVKLHERLDAVLAALARQG